MLIYSLFLQQMVFQMVRYMLDLFLGTCKVKSNKVLSLKDIIV